jgi:hypothetical protein
LEEGDDLTEAINAFIKECVCPAISEVEDEQRRKETERRLSASNEKMKELSKFLRKCDFTFKRELTELKKRAVIKPTEDSTSVKEAESQPIYRKPTENDPAGQWTEGCDGNADCNGGERNGGGVPQFIPEVGGPDLASTLTRAWRTWSKLVSLETRPITEGRKTGDGLRVLMSDDPNVSDQDRRVFGEFDDPVNDRDMIDKGIIWINANHPTIVERRTKSENDPVFLEVVANYVLMVVAQYHAQRQYDAEPEGEKSEPIFLFRQKFFKFQRDLRQENDVTYFDIE